MPSYVCVCVLFLVVIVIWQLQFSHFIEFYTRTHTRRGLSNRCATQTNTHTHLARRHNNNISFLCFALLCFTRFFCHNIFMFVRISLHTRSLGKNVFAFCFLPQFAVTRLGQNVPLVFVVKYFVNLFLICNKFSHTRTHTHTYYVVRE